MNAPENGLRSPFVSTTGGVMTNEAGSITGDLELSTTLSKGSLRALVRYAGAEEWYTVAGGAADVTNMPHDMAHKRIVEHLKTPGHVVEGNEEAVSLRGFFPA